MSRLDPYEQERLVCKVTGLGVLSISYHQTYPHIDKDGKPQPWHIRVPLPGVGTAKRRVWEDFWGKDVRDLLSNVLWGCGYALRYSDDQKSYEYYQKYEYDRSLKKWVEVAA